MDDSTTPAVLEAVQSAVAELLAQLIAAEVDVEAAERMVSDEQVPSFPNQAHQMAHDRYRACGLDNGSGMVKRACKLVPGVREKDPGIRWDVSGLPSRRQRPRATLQRPVV